MEIGIKSEKISAKSEVFFCFLGLDFYFGLQKGGTTTTPLLSAECQNIDCEGFRPLVSRDTAIFHKATF